MIAAEVSARRRTDVERHLYAFTLVVVTAATYRAQKHRARPDVAREHFRIAFEAAASQHHGAAFELACAAAFADCAHSDNSAIAVLN